MAKVPLAFKLSNTQRRRRYFGRKSIVAVMLLAVVTAVVGADRLGLFGRGESEQKYSWGQIYAKDQEKYHDKTFTVVKCIDGDTFDIDIPDTYGIENPGGDGGKAYRYKTTRIRLWGVDTPETRMRNRPVAFYGPQASAFVKRAVHRKPVRIELEKGQNSRDRTSGKRLLAWVYLADGRQLNRLLVEEGYAYADPKFPNRLRGELMQLQARAMKAKKGLWSRGVPADMPNYYKSGQYKLAQ